MKKSYIFGQTDESKYEEIYYTKFSASDFSCQSKDARNVALG